MIARNLINPSFGTEIMYSFIIIMCSLIIYFSTREMYELSSYKGLKYFRLAFLFFAVAYFFRSFIQLYCSQQSAVIKKHPPASQETKERYLSVHFFIHRITRPPYPRSGELFFISCSSLRE